MGDTRIVGMIENGTVYRSVSWPRLPGGGRTTQGLHAGYTVVTQVLQNWPPPPTWGELAIVALYVFALLATPSHVGRTLQVRIQ